MTAHPIAAFLLLTYSISWGGFIWVVGPGGFPGTGSQFDQLVPYVAAAMLSGPAIASIVVTLVLSGWTGLHDLLLPLTTWRLRPYWYVVAVAPAPIVSVVALSILSLDSPFMTASNRTAILWSGVAAGLTTVFEEIGWTGFAVRRLRRTYGVFDTGLRVGIVWGAWHFLQGLWIAGTYAGTIPLSAFVPLSFLCAVAQLTAYRVLMVWVHDRTESLLVVTLMHASLTASTVFLFAPLVTGFAFLAYGWVLTAALWSLVGIAFRGVRQEPPRHALRLPQRQPQ